MSSRSRLSAGRSIVPPDRPPSSYACVVRVFNFAQTPRVTLSSMRHPGHLRSPPSPNVRPKSAAGKHWPGSFSRCSCMALDPLHDRRMRHRTLPPVIISGLDSLTPAHTEDDDLSSNGGL